jgi:hypothetical protein
MLYTSAITGASFADREAATGAQAQTTAGKNRISKDRRMIGSYVLAHGPEDVHAAGSR